MVASSLLPSRGSLFWRRALLAPACLVLVAALQLGRVAAHHQSPWKGGGFGMFSTIDSPAARFVRLYVTIDGRRAPLAPPPQLAKIISELRTAPSQARVDELANLLVNETYVSSDAASDHARALVGKSPAATASPGWSIADKQRSRDRRTVVKSPQRVEVELWRSSFDRQRSAMGAMPLFTSQAISG